MRTTARLAPIPLLLLAACAGSTVDPAAAPPPAQPAPIASAAPSASSPWTYPAAPTSDASDTYFGKTYKDPLRPLEDLKAPQTIAWFKAEATLTDGLLDAIPGRDKLADEWLALDKLKPAKYSAFRFQAGKLFYKKVLGGESVDKVYARDGWGGKEELLFDPATYTSAVATEGKVMTVEDIAPSWNGKYLALALSSGGAEYSEIRVLDMARKTLLPGSIYPTFGVTSWAPDGRSFLYMATSEKDIRSPNIDVNVHTRRHQLATDVASDKVVFGNLHDPEVGMTPKEFAVAYVDQSAPGWVFGSPSTVQNEKTVLVAPIADLEKAKATWRSLARPIDNLVRGFELCGKDSLCAVTHTDAPRYKVVRTSLQHPDWAHAETVVPEAADSIQSMIRSKSKLLLVYSNGIVGRLVSYDIASKSSSEVPLPSAGDVSVDCPDARSNHCIVTLAGWIKPVTRYDLDGDRKVLTKSVLNTDVVYPGFDKLVAEEVEVKGHDGTMVPLSIIHRKDIPMDGSSSCILDGYGAYGYSLTPYFTEEWSTALHGVVLAIAHPRGGSEKGEAWYQAGKKTTKPNTWKDFISTAEYLVDKGYTSKEHLAGTGTSAGGILIGRAITERPDLFAAAIVNVGVANAMRAEFSPNGPVNTPEFGTVADPTEAAALFEMDAVQHVKPGTKYPAVLGVAGWNDPRVSPWQPGKFIAALQAANTSGKPELLKVNYDNGHFSAEKLVTYRNFATQYAFALWQTGNEEFQPAAR
jgi:prolyl oligopeptidase